MLKYCNFRRYCSCIICIPPLGYVTDVNGHVRVIERVNVNLHMQIGSIVPMSHYNKYYFGVLIDKSTQLGFSSIQESNINREAPPSFVLNSLKKVH